MPASCAASTSCSCCFGWRAVERQIRFWVLRCEHFDFVQMEILVVRQPDPHETGHFARGRNSQRLAALDAVERRAVMPVDFFPRLAVGG